MITRWLKTGGSRTHHELPQKAKAHTCRVPHVALFGTWVLGCSGFVSHSSLKNKKPGRLCPGFISQLVAGVRFELTTFGL